MSLCTPMFLNHVYMYVYIITCLIKPELITTCRLIVTQLAAGTDSPSWPLPEFLCFALTSIRLASTSFPQSTLTHAKSSLRATEIGWGGRPCQGSRGASK